ncbi:MAG TPA: transcriptional regulator [Noviherbaspirillum sp.]
MPTQEEKTAFSRRLALALRRSGEPVTGPTDLALRFNLRYRGAAISAQTAHKWLSGRTIPTADKLATLAEWLNVSVHWLHYGPPPMADGVEQAVVPYVASSPAAAGDDKPSQAALTLARKIQSLAPAQRYLVEELVEQLVQANL